MPVDRQDHDAPSLAMRFVANIGDPVDQTEELGDAIERSRREMENRDGVDLEAIVAESAYDYWRHRAALTRARQRIAERVGVRPDLAAIGAVERASLVGAIHRTQGSLRGGTVDLEAIAREGSSKYWSERRRIAEKPSAGDVDSAAVVGMAVMLRRLTFENTPRRERRKQWRDVIYDVAAVLLPLAVITPLLIAVSQGGILRPSLTRALTAVGTSFADRRFAIVAAMVMIAGPSMFWSAVHRPEMRRRVMQFGGAAIASVVVAVLAAAYVNNNRTASGLDRLQANLTTRLLLALEQSGTDGHLVPVPTDGSVIVETKPLTSSMSMLSARTPDVKGEILVRLRPESADYSWVLDGREMPKGSLTIGHVVAFDSKTGLITLRTGDRTTTLASGLSNATLPVGSRIAAEIGVDNRARSIVTLPPG